MSALLFKSANVIQRERERERDRKKPVVQLIPICTYLKNKIALVLQL